MDKHNLFVLTYVRTTSGTGSRSLREKKVLNHRVSEEEEKELIIAYNNILLCHLSKHQML